MNFFECPFSFYARKNPKLLALISKKKQWTYLECNQIINSIASSLKDLGVKKGSLVSFFPTTSYPTPLIFFALYRLEAIAFPLNTYLPIEATLKQLEQVKPALLLYPDHIILPKVPIRSTSFSTLLKKESFKVRQFFFQKETHSTYLYTSGTSTTPKIACLSMGNHYYSALGSIPYCFLETRNRWHLSLPLYHVAGISILFRCFLKGAAVVLCEKTPSIKEMLDLRITHLSYVPTQLQRLLMSDSPELTLLSKQLKCLLIGGAPLSLYLYKQGIEQGLKLHLTYGMTEMSSQICMQKESLSTTFSQGHPLPYRELSLAPDGEILVRGKTLFQGFLETNEKKVMISPLKEGWYATKDLASFSLKTGLKILGRKDRLFISGGENIHPEEIEEAMLNFPDIIEARVEAHPDKEFGFKPLAYIKSRDHFQKEALKEYLRACLPRYKIPIDFRLMSSKGSAKSFKKNPF